MMPQNNLILGEKTMWSGYYHMLLRLQQNKGAIRKCDGDYEIDLKSDHKLDPTDWELILKVISISQTLY